MEQITFNPNNELYYSEDFIKGFKCGAERQFEADKSDADRQQGEWIAKTENYHSHWVCSECGSWALLEYNEQMCLSNFCPNCGARMKGADDAD